MSTDTLTPRAAQDEDVEVEIGSRLVRHIDAAMLTHEAPHATSSDEFRVILTESGLGSTPQLLGRRHDGRPYDQIVLTYGGAGSAASRTWSRISDLGDTVVYGATADTTSTGYVTRSAS